MAWERSWARERSDGKRKSFDCTAIAAPGGREGVCAGGAYITAGGGGDFLGEAVAVGRERRRDVSPAVGVFAVPTAQNTRHRIRGVDSHACDPGS